MKMVKVKKSHKCRYCEKTIIKGETALRHDAQVPTEKGWTHLYSHIGCPKKD